jgi:hypothetical protein
MTPSHLFTKVAGVTHDNADGTSRQTVIAACQLGEKLDLIHDDKNAYDPNAIEVRRASGEQLGYLSARLAGEVARDNARGYRYAAFVIGLTGGGWRWRGCNLLVIIGPPGTTDEETQTYLDQLARENTDVRIAALVKTRDREALAPRGRAGCGAAILIAILAVVATLILGRG